MARRVNHVQGGGAVGDEYYRDPVYGFAVESDGGNQLTLGFADYSGVDRYFWQILDP